MIEVPTMLWQLDKLSQKVDFLSIGTNGLFQFILAAGQVNDRVTSRYDTLAPAFFRMLDQITRACGNGGAPVCVCGEMADHPLEALTLIGLGYSQPSMTAASIGPIKETIMSTNFRAIADFVDNLLKKNINPARGTLAIYAQDRQILT